ncbi:hypothetical protein BDW62DRAFT_209940 [Aspergillus aurantiobrunneus]
MEGPSIVIGIDFGTTFSGIAWTLGGSIDDIEVLSKWPGGGNRTSVKVPSDISYERQKIRWGYQVGPFTEACRGMKLLLDEDQDINYTPSIESKPFLHKYGKDAVQATADYLEQLMKQAKEVLERRLGIDTEDTDLQFVLTVPAVWSDKAKDATLRAVVDAGADIKRVSVVSEPEAAALYSLRAIQPNSIATNDVFIVCDAGGGTVDLISYKIKSLEPLCLAEVTEGTGAVCGSVLLDGRFAELLRQKMGQETYDALSCKSKEAAITYWQERVKPNFTGKYDDDFADVEYFIPVAGATDDPAIPIEDGFFLLSREDVEGIFEPIVRQIEELVAQQRSAIHESGTSAKAVLLVGGFGASEYLFHRLQRANPPVTILQPPNGGAVQRGLEGNKVESRIARRHYGVEYWADFNPKIHGDDNPDKHWDPLEEKYKISKRIRWYIKKSSKISENQPIQMTFYQNVEVGNSEDLIFHTDLEFCNEEQAPDVKNKKIMALCELEADLRQIPNELFERKTNSKGVEYFRIFFVLTMIPTSASLLFELEFNGVSYGSVRSRY